jgi:aspartyl-tRNA(Asn)/glutamyl-tRNA(Gln) amidotransferase subunit A
VSTAFLSAAELNRAYERRELSPVEVTRELLQRIERLDPELRAFITLTPERAMDQARAAEARFARGSGGPLTGIPIGIKDLFDVAGVRCTAGSKILADHVPDRDAFVVERLAVAGAVSLGKQNLHEFAYGFTNTNVHWGVCRNPWNRERVPGGSSGGAAVALATGMCTLALGTDTGGSIRIPAAACGVVGLKPTYGRVSRSGVFPLSWSLDHVGPMARSVEDVKRLLPTLAAGNPAEGLDEGSPLTLPPSSGPDLRGLRIGIPGPPFTEGIDGEVAKAVDDAAALLERLGGRLVPLDTRPLGNAYTAVHAIVASEAGALHERWMRERPEDYGIPIRKSLSYGFLLSGVDYVNAKREQARATAAIDAMFAEVDVMITPTLPRTALAIGQPTPREPSTAWNRLVSPFNLTGVPALSLPCGFDRAGLPIGLQIVGRAFEEETVLNVGAAYERETSWNQRRPPGLDEVPRAAVDV